jgi:hypothetical protein
MEPQLESFARRGLADMGENARYWGGLGDKGDDAHVGTAARTGERQGLEQACKQHRPEVTGRGAGCLLAVRSSGAYGFTISANCNSRPRAAEVMVDGGEAYLARKRETLHLQDLYAGESTLP